MLCLLFPKRQILDSSKLKEFADDNFEFDDESGRKFSERWENTVIYGEIAHYDNFSFSHSVFKRPLLQTRKKQGLFGKGLKGDVVDVLDALIQANHRIIIVP